MPCFSTISNHAEDVVSMFSAALKERSGCTDQSNVPHVSIPLRVEPEVHGLILASTKREFCAYMTKQIESSTGGDNDGDVSHGGVTKTHRCLVCVKDPDDIDRIEKMTNRTIEHYVDVRSATPKIFVRNKPKGSTHEWAQCQMKITAVGGQSKNFRAACVTSKFGDSNDVTLAHRLWGPNVEHPAEDLGVQYVMQIDVQLLNPSKRHPHQIRGQLAALGIPIVGDVAYGGGVCEMRMHRHTWNRMAVQICHLEFCLPKWEEKEEEEVGKQGEDDRNEDQKNSSAVLVPGDEKCLFHLNTAWWSEYLVDYERHLMSGDLGTVSAKFGAMSTSDHSVE